MSMMPQQLAETNHQGAGGAVVVDKGLTEGVQSTTDPGANFDMPRKKTMLHLANELIVEYQRFRV